MQNEREEIVLVNYYNVKFYLRFQVGTDEFLKNLLLARIDRGENMKMKDICGWCIGHNIPFSMKFSYRKDFSIMANAWNFYSYCRFRIEVWKIKFKERLA